ncbi:putative UDP-glucose 4-epimerase [Hibiscus syriacus]|uniref:UDP-glucose 4-epimerase n=1 Tax=Hibiscus syriacus TaxID=106335 RepID=A0A6A3CYF4_HIBSY|nr:putative UDP-glucose 4-epimerase [Hibiscus syriacus]
MEHVKEAVKEEREQALAIACRIMAGISPVSGTNSQAHQPFTTPSPFSFSGASTRPSYRPSLHQSNLYLRFLVLLFSFILANDLLASPSTLN